MKIQPGKYYYTDSNKFYNQVLVEVVQVPFSLMGDIALRFTKNGTPKRIWENNKQIFEPAPDNEELGINLPKEK